MSSEEKRLLELEEAAARLMEKREELSKLVKHRRTKRDRLNESVKSLRSMALSEKEQRDQLNEKVAELKGKVEELSHDLDEKRRRLFQLEEEQEESRRKLLPRGKLEQELQRIEWELSTTPTVEMREREAQLVERGREIERTLGEHDRFDAKDDLRLMSAADSKAIELEIRRSRDEMMKLRDESQIHHEKMLQFFAKADEERKKADKSHAGFLASLSSMREVDAEFDRVMGEVRELRLRLREEERLEALKRERSIEEMRRELVAEVRRKLETGEKLSLEELKLIYEEEK